MFDILIPGATILDGTGREPFQADIGIVGDTIAAMGDLTGASAGTTLRPGSSAGTGRHTPVVCPGFIDVHSHSDAYLLIEPSAPSKLYQGVTTEVVGNCGASAAPLWGAYRLPSDWRGQSYPGSWRTVAEYRALLDQVRPAVNVVLLTGHNTLRAGVAGYENRPLIADEWKQAARVLEQSMDEGSRGLSTGLIYVPGMYAPREEIIALAEIVARRGGIYTSHMRSEGKGLLAAIEETLHIGRVTGARIEISHLKTSGRAHWGLAGDALRMIRAARREGVKVAADRYPYTASATDLDVVFPAWAEEGGPEAVWARLRDDGVRARIRRELLETYPAEYWESVTIGSTVHSDTRPFQGLPLMEVARRLDREPVDAVLFLLERDQVRTGAFFSGMSEENMFTILAEPYVMIGSDASLRAPTGPLAQDYPHPRAYGSFVRFLRWSFDGKTVPLPEAVRKMTSLPAEHFCLSGRGVLAKGMKADLVIVNLAGLEERTSFADPHQLAAGLDTVIVNGVVTLDRSGLTGRRAGRVLDS